MVGRLRQQGVFGLFWKVAAVLGLKKWLIHAAMLTLDIVLEDFGLPLTTSKKTETPWGWDKLSREGDELGLCPEMSIGSAAQTAGRPKTENKSRWTAAIKYTRHW